MSDKIPVKAPPPVTGCHDCPCRFADDEGRYRYCRWLGPVAVLPQTEGPYPPTTPPPDCPLRAGPVMLSDT